ncbi:MAG TPA: class I tRNA ligase family protein, partial [Microbacteriaceae bacterium]|nr:class I tRNA ligase family protein [Microbacteriaceae bacterium]
IGRHRLRAAIAEAMRVVGEVNKYLTLTEPYKMKDDSQRERLGTVLYTAAEGLRALAVLLSPVMPEACEKLWIALGAAETLGRLHDQPIRDAGTWGQLGPGTSVNGLAPLFPRVESTVD